MKTITTVIMALVLTGCLHNRSNVTYIFISTKADGEIVVRAEGARRVDADKSVESAISGAQTGSPSAATSGKATAGKEVKDVKDGKDAAGKGAGQAKGGSK